MNSGDENLSRAARAIDRLRKEKGLSMRALSLKCGLSESTVKKILSGTVSSPRYDTLSAIAQGLGVPILDLVAETTSTEHMAVIGRVQAGLWAEEESWPPSVAPETDVPLDNRFLAELQFCLEVGGPSMNRIFPEGTILLCVAWGEIGRSPQDGELVVVRRTNAEGRVEGTVKRIRRDIEDRWWLWPESDDPRYQQPWPLFEDESGAQDGETIEIAAKVLGYRVPFNALPL